MRNRKVVLLALAIALVIGGLVLVIMGQMIGLLALFAGFALAFGYVFIMMRGAGYHPTSAGLADGDSFPGRQQSQVAKDKAQPVMDEKPVNIWEQITETKK